MSIMQIRMHILCCLTHYQMTNFSLFQIERVCNDNFKFDEYGRKLSKCVENGATSTFPTVFSKACFPGASKGVIVWEWVNLDLHWPKWAVSFNPT